MLCCPATKGALGVNVQLPLAAAVALPNTSPLLNTVMLAPASAPVPLMVGVLSMVLPLAAMVSPASLLIVMADKREALVSTRRLTAVLRGPAFPATSVCRAWT